MFWWMALISAPEQDLSCEQARFKTCEAAAVSTKYLVKPWSST